MLIWRIALVAAAVAIGMTILDAAPAAAASRATEWSSQNAQRQRQRPRVEIRPGGLYYRECVDGLQRVNRPYWGTTVLMPYMRCWWVRR
jgi:hypothetical protein